MAIDAAPPALDLDPILGALDPEQRAAASLPDGPAQIIAPAGSGKTTTMVARLAVLLARGVPAERICVVTFNRDAAIDLAARVARRLTPSVPSAASIEIRTLHALARQVLLDAGEGRNLVADRLPLLRAARRRAADDPTTGPDPSQLDTWLSAWKIEGRAPPPEGRPILDAYADLLRMRGALDFDDLVVRACHLLETDAALGRRWQTRFSHLCVDEFQDVDAAQLRLVRLLAEPERNLFVVGDDDQTIYAWRLADVRRILTFDRAYPGARRVQLATNYRCPPAVVTVSAALIDANRERFRKRIVAAPTASEQPGTVLAVSTADEGWPDGLARLAVEEARAGRTICFLARTRSELGPVLIALVRANQPHVTTVPAQVQAEPVRTLVTAARQLPGSTPPFLALQRLRAGRGWRRADAADAVSDDDHAAMDALLSWAVGMRRLDRFLDEHDRVLARLDALRVTDGPVELVTVHGAKGREWQTVVVLGMEEERFPNRRALLQGAEPERALEEERRLAYVALTRATRRLILAFDPSRPSRFLGEMGLHAGRPPARDPPPAR